MNWRRVAAAIAAGTLAGALPPLSSSRAGLDWLAAGTASFTPAAADAGVVLVLVDAHTADHAAFAAYPRANWSYPLAGVVGALLDAGATVVALDFVMPRVDGISADWLRVLRRGGRDGRIVLGMMPGDHAVAPSTAQVAAAGGAHVLASVSLHADPDGLVRTVRPREGPLPGLGAAVAAAGGAEVGRDAPLAGPGVPALDAWAARALLECPEDPALRAAMAGRAVIVGAWLPHEDRHRSGLHRLPRKSRTVAIRDCSGVTHTTVEEPVPGVWLHALAAARWLQGAPTLPGTVPDRLAAAIGAGAAATLAAAGRPGWFWSVLAGWTAFAFAAFRVGVVMPWVAPAVAMLAAAAVVTVSRYREAAWRFLAGLPRAFRLRPEAAETRRVAACFVDIEAFTAASEAAEGPARLARELGTCLQRLAATATRHGGFVDKYLGDGMLVLFGLESADGAARRAVAAAVEWMDACGKDPALRLGGAPVRLRIGIACGDARVGALGADARAHFTAIGDCVNVAARLEQLNRALGTRVLADADTVSEAPAAGWTDRGWQTLRGRHGKVRVYALNVRNPPL